MGALERVRAGGTYVPLALTEAAAERAGANAERPVARA